ncbi:hypothetical protein AVEN_58279-1 [Araneus ventricosus]|uniref:CCHC-type domain-containing protein n=1 Tax=Araneus ventricosus TaxID=182803 RepID=A0A4Y2TF88_ARAVE|nr:hypothetical protein AVEN_58279-1 [Araneus ventricosus]
MRRRSYFHQNGGKVIGCSGYFHAARNRHLKPRCIKCGGEHTTRECSIKEKIAEPKCVNCGESGHQAEWRGCNAIPVIKTPSTRQPGRSYAQATAEKTEKKEQTTGRENKRPFGFNRHKRIHSSDQRSKNTLKRVPDPARSGTSLQENENKKRQSLHIA